MMWSPAPPSIPVRRFTASHCLFRFSTFIMFGLYVCVHVQSDFVVIIYTNRNTKLIFALLSGQPASMPRLGEETKREITTAWTGVKRGGSWAIKRAGSWLRFVSLIFSSYLGSSHISSSSHHPFAVMVDWSVGSSRRVEAFTDTRCLPSFKRLVFSGCFGRFWLPLSIPKWENEK